MGGVSSLVYGCFYQAYSQPYEELVQAIKTLHEGGMIAHPTETYYGGGGYFQRTRSANSIDSKMPLDKPVSILVRNLEEAQRYGSFHRRRFNSL